MLEYKPPSDEAGLDDVFRALAHPVRRNILGRIGEQELSISEIAKPFDMTFEGVSQHVRVLERAGLLKRTRVGRVHSCRLDPRPLRDAATTLQHLARFWDVRLDALDRLLDAEEG